MDSQSTYIKHQQQTLQIQIQQIEQTTQNMLTISIWIYVLILTIMFFIYLSYKLKQVRKRKRKPYQNIKYIPKNKIILAIQIKDFIVWYDQKKLPGYLPLNVQNTSTFYQNLKRKIFQSGNYYKPMFSVQKIKQFFTGLSTIQKVSLMLYTSLDHQVAQVILNKLGIQKFFPSDMRKFCDLDNHDDKKHAISVDQYTNRVIIITPTKTDHHWQDQKYFLIVKPKTQETHFLKKILKDIKTFVQSNVNVMYLHDQLTQLKLELESEISDNQM